ncbi:hypothetical protein, partial [Paramuribaculum intestinale]|uniref:hypothetical protein n=1 Tax=Paramuribaculum intestinale TaxID=2094151 RepID=UPI00272AF066
IGASPNFVLPQKVLSDSNVQKFSQFCKLQGNDLKNTSVRVSEGTFEGTIGCPMKNVPSKAGSTL